MTNARVLAMASLTLAGCGASPAPLADAGADVVPDARQGAPDAGSGGAPDATRTPPDGGYKIPDAGPVPASRFITKVVAYTVGPCGGFNESALPGVVEGPPYGAGATMGSVDVFSLGNGGQIVVSFEPDAIVDGPGPDFIVFENAFEVDGTSSIYAEPGEVSVSEDGVHWSTFEPCDDTTGDPPFGACAGVHPVYSNPDGGPSPFDWKTAGGDAYDLASLEGGVTLARYVRIVDKMIEPCDGLTTNGFDLDAIAIVNAATP